MSYRQWNIPGTAFFIALMICLLPVPVTGKTMPAGRLPLSAQYSVSAALGKDQQQFHVRATPDGSLLENQSQKFIARIFSSGQLVLDTRGHYLKMEPISLGFSSATVQRRKGVLKYSANRISLDYGLYSEWLVNGPMGLQQGFTIKKRPEHTLSQHFTLTLNVDSDLRPDVNTDERGISFFNKEGTPVFQYTGLMVVDARKRELPARMEISEHQIRIVVDDTKAVYPVIVDPIFQQAKLTASDGAADDSFGRSVAIDGDTVVVGAPEHNTGNKQGAAYVFRKPATGWANMTQIAKLTASDGTTTDWFGSSVAISNGTIAVGADSASAGSGSTRPGAAYIFVKPNTGWTNMTQTAKLTSSDGGDMDRFGGSIAIAGDTVVVGADGANTGGNVNQGKAYIFVKPPTGWTDMTETAQLTASDGIAHDLLGWSVSLYDDTIVVGAPGDQDYQGSVYVFAKPQTGWTDIHQSAKLMASDGVKDDQLGYSVSIYSNTIVAGAPGFHTSNQSNLGAAYIFTRSGTHWIDMEETTELRANDVMTGDRFGQAVAIDNNTVIVGSPNHNYSGTASNGMPFVVFNMGAVYSFTKPVNGWPVDMRAKAEMISNDGHADDHLGESVAISEKTVVAGAPDQDISGRQDQGSAYVFCLKKKSSWPMLVSAITSHVGYLVAGNKAAGHPTSGSTSTYRLYIGSFSLSYTNKVMPHYSWVATPFCYILMPVIGDIGQLKCCPDTANYDADENDGGMRIRRKGSIAFNPSGTCSKSLHSCIVEPHGTGSETIWQWYSTDNGLTWTLVLGMPVTMPIIWQNNPHLFDEMDIVHGDMIQTVKVSTGGGEIESTLNLISRP